MLALAARRLHLQLISKFGTRRKYLGTDYRLPYIKNERQIQLATRKFKLSGYVESKTQEKNSS